MSFILDALRKSEHDRQREKGPGLAEVAVAPPKSKKNIWATVAVALFVVNLVAIGVLLLRRAGQESDVLPVATGNENVSAETPSLAPAAATTQSATGPAPATPAPSYPAPANEAYQARVVPGTVPPVLQPALPADGTSAAHNPLADELSDGASSGADTGPGYDEYPTAPPGMSGPPARPGSVIYERVPEADPITSASRAQPAEYPGAPAAHAQSPGTVSTQNTASLPTADEIGAQAGLPELHLDIHVYSNKPSERFVFVNSRKYREGETLQEGPRVDRITPDAAELSYRGNRFALPRP